MSTSIITPGRGQGALEFPAVDANSRRTSSKVQKIPFERRLFRTLFRKQVGLTISFLVLMALGIALLAIWPRSYSSTAMLTVDSSKLDHMSIIGKTQSVQRMHEEEVNSVLAMLNSRKMKELVTDRLGKSTILKEESPATLGDRAKQLINGTKVLVSKCLGLYENYSDREHAIITLDKNVEIKSKRRSSIIEVRAISNSPESAQEIANTFIEEFIAYHTALHTSDKKIEFHKKEVARLTDQIGSLDKQITDFKNENAMLDFAGDRTQLIQSLGKIKTAVLENEQQVESAQAGLEKLTSDFDQIPETVSQSQTINSTAGTARDRMREQLYRLEIDANLTTSMFTDSHPKVVAIKNQLKEAQKVFNNQAGTNDSETKAMNPLKQKTEALVLQKQMALRELERKGKMLADQVRRLEDQSVVFNQRETQLNALERERKTIEKNRQLAITRLEQERVFEGMKQKENSAIIVAQPANKIEKAFSPSKRLGFLGVSLFSLFMVGSCALIFSKLDDQICSEEDITSVLGMRVLALVDTPKQVENLFGFEDLTQISRKLNFENEDQCSVALVHVSKQHSELDESFVNDFADQLDHKVLHLDLNRKDENADAGDVQNKQLTELIQPTDVENLSRIHGKDLVKAVWEQRRNLHAMFDGFDLICLSAGQLDSAGLRSSIASRSDSTIVVVESGTSLADLQNALNRLNLVGANVGGVILINENDPIPNWLLRLVA